MIIDPI